MSVLVARLQELRALVSMMQTYVKQQPNGQCWRCCVIHHRAFDRSAHLNVCSWLFSVLLIVSVIHRCCAVVPWMWLFQNCMFWTLFYLVKLWLSLTFWPNTELVNFEVGVTLNIMLCMLLLLWYWSVES